MCNFAIDTASYRASLAAMQRGFRGKRVVVLLLLAAPVLPGPSMQVRLGNLGRMDGVTRRALAAPVLPGPSMQGGVLRCTGGGSGFLQHLSCPDHQCRWAHARGRSRRNHRLQHLSCPDHQCREAAIMGLDAADALMTCSTCPARTINAGPIDLLLKQSMLSACSASGPRGRATSRASSLTRTVSMAPTLSVPPSSQAVQGDFSSPNRSQRPHCLWCLLALLRGIPPKRVEERSRRGGKPPVT